jgi:hypothetical protein
VRYGERTARGIAGGKKVCCALTLGERRRARSGKKIMVRRDIMKDIALLDRHGHQLQAKKKDRGRVGHSQSGARELQSLGQGMRLPVGCLGN